ncbi:hypothetical protein C8J56DRAFT_1080135 [Mycena floridula]|nr:hypothetical protein C8J56DRAFT_1080135 [Mycena floridula]
MSPALLEISPLNQQQFVENIFGPVLVGVLFSTLLYGINVVQVFTYHETSSKRDALWIRGLVFFLFFSVTLNTAFNMFGIYQPLVQQFGANPGQLQPVMPVFLRTDPIMTAIVSMPVQVLMAWRIKVVTEMMLWSGIIIVIAMVSFAASIWTTVHVALQPDFSKLSQFRTAPITWLVTSSAADIIIAGVLVHSLHARKSGFNNALDAYMNRIIRLTVQTGALTAVFALSDALVFSILKDSTIFFAWDLSLSKLYLMTILSSLNARDSFKHKWNVLFPSSDNGIRSQSAMNFRGSMAAHLVAQQSPGHIDMEMQPVQFSWRVASSTGPEK